jgi:uncharacterized short protein YbdD (DUF466 family)
MTKLPGAIWNVARGSAWRPPRSGGEAQGELRSTQRAHGQERGPGARPGTDICDGPSMPSNASLGSTIGTSLRALWRGLRAVTGDDAYDRYLEHHAAQHPGAAPLSRRAFYEAEQKRQWSRINRCC